MDPIKQALREDERQEKLLEEALRVSDLLDPVRRRSLFRHVLKQVEADAPRVSTKAKKPKPTPTTEKPEGATSYANRAETFVLANKKGVTTRQVSDHIGQNYSSTDSTLRHVLDTRHTIEHRDNLWVPSGKANGAARKRPMTHAEAIAAAFERVGNKPMAAKDIFKAVTEIIPTAKKPSIDAQLVYMRRRGALVQKGDAPHGGGLYCLANFGGAQAATAS